MTDETGVPGPGRPRDPRVQETVLRAAHDLLVSMGYAHLTMGHVAQAAGVGKPTLYRRWPNKDALVADAVTDAFRRREEEVRAVDPETMPAREVVAETVRLLYGHSTDGVGVHIVARVMAEAEQTPALMETLREHALEPRRQLLLDTLRNLQKRHALRSDLDLHTIADLCLGAYLAAYLRDGPASTDADRTRASRVVDALWPHIHPTSAADPP